MQTNDRVVQFPGLPSEMYGSIIAFRPMQGKTGLFPIVRWDCGYESYASQDWGLKKVRTRLEKLKERIGREFDQCSVVEKGSQVYIVTPGATFWINGGKLDPYIPSARYKALSKLIEEVWQ